MDLLEYMNSKKNMMLPMHMPGHKRNTALAPYLEKLSADCDMTEIEGLDNLHDAAGILREGMEKTSSLWGSRRAFWLVNGSTCGILAGIWAAIPEEGKVIVARNCHQSVYNGLLLRHANAVYLMPDIDAHTGIFSALKPESIAAALEQNPDTKLVVLTSPTYEGIISDIGAICRIAHEKAIPVLVDEAHGSHLGFGCGFPKGAISCGADIVIHSLHKTLPSLTQTAVLHLNGELVGDHDIEKALSIFETSSPSYLLMASISGCTALMEKKGQELLQLWRTNLQQFYQKTEKLENLYLFNGSRPRDPSKLVICTDRTNIAGAQLAGLLRRNYHIEIEMASMHYIVAMTGMGDTAESIQTFADALTSIDAKAHRDAKSPLAPPLIPRQAMTYGEALKRRHEPVALSQAVGRVSAETVFAYPPGIPLLLPGEVITPPDIRLFQQYEARGIHLKSTYGLIPQKIMVTDG